MNNSYKIILFSILIVLCSSCEEEYLVITETEEEGQETIELVNTTIEGIVLDLSALPLSNVLVDLSVDNAILSSTISNEEGKFTFDNVSANEERTLLIFHHTDHTTSYKVMSPKEDLTHYTEMLMQENSVSIFNENETISYTDDLISFSIGSQQLDLAGSSTIKSETNVIDEETINKNFLVPVNGIDEVDNDVQLEHKLIVQIDLFDPNNKAIGLSEGEAFELIPNTSLDLDQIDLWFFNEREAIWQIDEANNSTNSSTYALTKTGLYSLAKRNESYLITGTITDENGEAIPNVKVTIRDENGNIINEVFTNSSGEYMADVNKDLKGDIILSEEGEIVEEISFVDVTDPKLNTISIVDPVITCKELIVDIELPNCAGVLSPSAILEGDISGLQFFGLSIEGNIYGVLDSEELYEIMDWESLYGKTTTYTMTNTSEGVQTEICTNTITVKDALPPALVCLANLTVKLNDEMKALIYAEDIDNGSFNNTCFGASTLNLEIVRNDLCDGECKDSDYGPSVEFNSEDLDKEIGVTLKPTGLEGSSNSCWAIVLVTD